MVHCIHRHFNYAKQLAEYISVYGACLESQNKKPQNVKGVVATPLKLGDFSKYFCFILSVKSSCS